MGVKAVKSDFPFHWTCFCSGPPVPHLSLAYYHLGEPRLCRRSYPGNALNLWKEKRKTPRVPGSCPLSKLVAMVTTPPKWPYWFPPPSVRLHEPLLWCRLNVATSFYEFWEIWAFLGAQMVKHLSAMWESWDWSLGREDPLERKWQPTPVLLPGESHGWRSLVGYSHGVAKSRTRLSEFSLSLWI